MRSWGEFGERKRWPDLAEGCWRNRGAGRDLGGGVVVRRRGGYSADKMVLYGKSWRIYACEKRGRFSFHVGETLDFPDRKRNLETASAKWTAETGLPGFRINDFRISRYTERPLDADFTCFHARRTDGCITPGPRVTRGTFRVRTVRLAGINGRVALTNVALMRVPTVQAPR